MLVPVHDLESGDRALVPVLDLAENSLDVIGYRPPAKSGIGDRNRVRRDLVGEISFDPWMMEWFEIQCHRFMFEHKAQYSHEHI
jgi:hypothetical protein